MTIILSPFFFANLILLLLKNNYKFINQIIFLTAFEEFETMYNLKML